MIGVPAYPADGSGDGAVPVSATPTSAVPIVDPDDERISDYRALTDVELRTRWEPPHGLFIAEGELVLRRAVRAGYVVRSVLIDATARVKIFEAGCFGFL
jgi:hypothetical protein